MKKLILLYLIISNFTFAQISEITKFNKLMRPVTTPASSIVETESGELIIFWSDSTKLFYSKSTDYGKMWNIVSLLYIDSIASHLVTDINSLRLRNGRILITFKSIRHFILYSDDNGNSWSEPMVLPTAEGIIRKRYVSNSTLNQISDTLISFVYSSEYHTTDHIIFRIKSKDGINWSEDIDTLYSQTEKSSYGNLIALSDQQLLLIFLNENNVNTEDYTKSIYQISSEDGGLTWSDPVELIHSVGEISRVKVIQDSTGTIWLFFQKELPTPFEEFTQSDILYIKSTDNGNTWSTSQTFTTYKGFDGWHNVNLVNNKPLISFSSTRYTELLGSENIYNIFFGLIEESNDIFTPPVIYDKEFVYINDYPKVNMKIRALINDDEEIGAVFFNYKFPDSNFTRLELYDDGLHNDKQADDGIYGNIIKGLSFNYRFTYYFEISDVDRNINTTILTEIKSPLTDEPTVYGMDVNNIWLPLNNRGVLADVRVTDSVGVITSQGRFEESVFLYSGGFALSGYTNGKLWANGVMSTSRIEDYYPGKVGSEPENIKNRVYFLKSSYKAFSETWQLWKDAVELGAKFYDGDGDGVYNPVDKNGNGYWDPNEDRPDLLGDQTAWCVYNDGVPSARRRFSNVSPQGIEIKQTVFAYSPKTYPELANVIFIRYNIENKGTVIDKLDSVYFSAWSDPDLGDYVDDLIGCDTSINSSYCYNEGNDVEYGSNPPAFFTVLLQGPAAFLQNETFVDNNGNGIFDEGIDSPIDSAIYNNGLLLNPIVIPGAKNKDLTSVMHYMQAHPTQGDPVDEMQLRCYMEGKNQKCEYINPCDWVFGEVYGINCENIDPKFMYSGDPVTQYGWVNTEGYDQRQLFGTGPFVLEKGKPIEIIVAYVVGRGTDALNSITVAKNIVKDAAGFYGTNFQYIPVGVKENKLSKIPTEFVLEQNYPNPFNPSTTIKYSIPNIENQNAIPVQLKVFDVLGREVATLVNKKQSPGNYEVRFNARSISSGVYYYQLKAGDFIQTKKMILLK